MNLSVAGAKDAAVVNDAVKAGPPGNLAPRISGKLSATLSSPMEGLIG